MIDERMAQKKRMWDLLAPLVFAEDKLFSNAEFIYQLKKRFDLEWNRQQAILDPNE